MSEEKHLWCEVCEYQPTIAEIDGLGKVVCHCTHDGGEIEPVPVAINPMPALPDRWVWRTHGSSNDTLEENP